MFCPDTHNSHSSLIAMTMGGVIFWLPDIFLHGLRQKEFSGADTAILTVLLPAIALLTSIWLGEFWTSRFGKRPWHLWTLLGIWVIGPWLIWIGWTIGGRSSIGDLSEMFLLCAVFPFGAYVMSTYDGTLWALLFSTVLLPFAKRGATHHKRLTK
jgi:hypothetical protein